MISSSAHPAARCSSLISRALLGLWLWSSSIIVTAEPLSIAVASNFRLPLIELLQEGLGAGDDDFRLNAAASGLLFAQIQQGARYHLFFSADGARPERLMQLGVGIPGSLRPYAIGQLVLWLPNRQLAWDDALEAFRGLIAIANPLHAPYGAAAETLVANGWLPDRKDVVFAANVGIAFQYAEQGVVEGAFISKTQALFARLPEQDLLTIDPRLYPVIEQKRVVLAIHPLGEQLLAYLDSSQGADHLRRLGYQPPTLPSIGNLHER